MPYHRGYFPDGDWQKSNINLISFLLSKDVLGLVLPKDETAHSLLVAHKLIRNARNEPGHMVFLLFWF